MKDPYNIEEADNDSYEDSLLSSEDMEEDIVVDRTGEQSDIIQKEHDGTREISSQLRVLQERNNQTNNAIEEDETDDEEEDDDDDVVINKKNDKNNNIKKLKRKKHKKTRQKVESEESDEEENNEEIKIEHITEQTDKQSNSIDEIRQKRTERLEKTKKQLENMKRHLKISEEERKRWLNTSWLTPKIIGISAAAVVVAWLAYKGLC